MTARPAEAANKATHKVFVGDKVHLNDDIPCGLFEASNGNKYIITSAYFIDEQRLEKIAIALAHLHLAPFTLQFLDEQPLEYGCWRGPYRIRLVNALQEECGMNRPGVISLGDRHASIQCRYLDGSAEMVSIGYVGRKGFAPQDFDGWVIEPTKSRQPFFERKPDGGLNLVVEPKRKQDEASATICNAFKRMHKEGMVERKLARPDSTEFLYRLIR